MKSVRLVVLSGIAAIIVAGCGSQGGKGYVPFQPKDGGGTTTPPNENPTKPSPTESNTPVGEVPGINPKTGSADPLKIPKGTFDIKPAENSAKITPAVLGQKVDEAFAQLTNAWADADTVTEVGGAQLAGKSTIKVKDSKTFKVEFYDTETQATLNRVIANGTDRVQFYKEVWSKLPAPGAGGGSVADVTKEWPTEFLTDMFRFYSKDERVWGKVMAGLSSAQSGYTTKLEEKTVKVLGKDRKLYRLVADKPTDGTEVEIMVDGVRFLPVTVRSIVKSKDGKQDSRLWTCNWKFGGTFDSKEFVLPKAAGS